MNRLGKQLSPYLRQHAHNPVDWYPWGDEAFAKARAEDKPILLSIGYSACHWCHVMERESFENAAIAHDMNESFVSVKVDREERPDVDHIYQLVVQMMGRSGGWPLTVFLTPTLHPFFGGTYFPDVEKHGMPSFPAVLAAVSESFRTRRDEVEASAKDIASEIQRVSAPATKPGDIPRDIARGAASLLAKRFDPVNGGFGMRPKFPNTMALDLFLRAAHDGDRPSLARADQALVAMRAGGIWDQLGSGYHRYSTDERWLVPHFEKMLYDNALLMRTHAEGFRATAAAIHSEAVLGIAEYLEREMRSPEGLFFSTQDADTEGEEGRFFVWTPGELEAALGPELARIAALRFGVTKEGNFEHKPSSVLSVVASVAAIAKELGLDEAQTAQRIEEARAKLFAARAKRPAPFRDEKIIASWNGLVIGALAEASGALGDTTLASRARTALEAVRTHLWKDGTLFRIHAGVLAERARTEMPASGSDGSDRPASREHAGVLAERARTEVPASGTDGSGRPASRDHAGVLAERARTEVPASGTDGSGRPASRDHDEDGVTTTPGFLEDYADVASAAIDVAEACDAPEALAFARELFAAAKEAFWDEAQGAFYFARSGASDLIARTSDAYDHAVPSSVATMAHVALRLSTHDGDAALEALATRVLRAYVSPALASPLGLSHALGAMDRLVRGPTEIIVVGASGAEDTEALLRTARAAWQPNRVLARVDPAGASTSAGIGARLEGRRMRDGVATAYVCRDRTCGLPITDAALLAEELAPR